MVSIPVDVLEKIYLFAGGLSASRAALSCKAWSLSARSPLYAVFIKSDFGLDVTRVRGLDPSNAEFAGLYHYFHESLKESRIENLLTEAKIEFADDGGDAHCDHRTLR